MSKLMIVLMAVITLPGALIAQSPILIRTDDPSMKFAPVHTAHIMYKITLFDSAGNVVDKLVNDNNIQVDSVAGIIHTSKIARFKNSIYENSSATAAGSFIPISMEELNKPLIKRVTVSFKKESANVNFLLRGITRDSSWKMPAGYFDDNVIEELIGYFPLKKNTKYTADAFRFESNGNNKYEFEYLFDDLLQTGQDQFAKCRVVKFRNGYLDGFIWYDARTNTCLKEVGYGKNFSFYIERI